MNSDPERNCRDTPLTVVYGPGYRKCQVCGDGSRRSRRDYLAHMRRRHPNFALVYEQPLTFSLRLSCLVEMLYRPGGPGAAAAKLDFDAALSSTKAWAPSTTSPPHHND